MVPFRDLFTRGWSVGFTTLLLVFLAPVAPLVGYHLALSTESAPAPAVAYTLPDLPYAYDVGIFPNRVIFRVAMAG